MSTFSTLAASVRLRYDVPEDAISSCPTVCQNTCGLEGSGKGKSYSHFR